TDLPDEPPGRTITLSSTINGDAAIAHCKFSAPLSLKIFLPHRTAPVFAFKQRSSPVAPRAYNHPSSYVGVVRGPSPVSSVYPAVHDWIQTSRPVFTSYAATTSCERRCSIVYARPSATETDA